MTIKRKFILGVINEADISKVNDVITPYVTEIKDISSHMYFAKQPIDSTHIPNDVFFFQITAENELKMNKKVENMINDLQNLKVDYVLRDEETGEFLVTVKYGGQVAIKFDHIKFLKKGTFQKIDELKFFNTEYGYCKGFKPNFRPLEDKSIEDIEVLPEIIYITANSEENLLKLRDYLFDKVSQINPDLETEFTWFFR